jgi:hypothetical protein
MNYQLIRDALKTLLEAGQTGKFETVMFQRQRKAAETALGVRRKVQVFWKGGMFPENIGQMNGPFQHNPTFQFDLTTVDKAKIDLATLNNPSATAAQRITALEGRQEAAEIANASMDQLFDDVYQILMDPANRDLGLPVGIVIKRWINQFQKDDPVETGELVILTGAFLFTCQTNEVAGADIGPAVSKTYQGTQTTSDIETEIEEDTTSATETQVITT